MHVPAFYSRHFNPIESLKVPLLDGDVTGDRVRVESGFVPDWIGIGGNFRAGV